MNQNQQKTNQQKPFIPKHITQSKSWNPDKETNDELYNKMQKYFIEGNYQKIFSWIQNNKININIVDTDNKNALHYIINNDTLTENEKYELIKLCIKIGIDINAYDQNNITPLHLACEIQSYKIVELLLREGADPNKLTSEGKNSLHYAVIGKQVDCPKYNKNKIKSLINNKSEKKEESLKKLEAEINLLLSNDNFVNINIQHLKTYLESYKDIYPQKHKDFTKDAQEIISEILKNTQINSNDKEKALLKKIMSEKEHLIKKFQEDVDYKKKINIKFGINQENGWNPSGSTDEKKIIIKYYLNN
jgi:hypothetical protein